MEQENKICVEQARFRTRHSTIDHIFTLYSMALKHHMEKVEANVRNIR